MSTNPGLYNNNSDIIDYNTPKSSDVNEDDDVDLFVSPRRFGGSTPSAKQTKERVFKHNDPAKKSGEVTKQKSEESADDESLDIGEHFDLGAGHSKHSADHSAALRVMRISQSQTRAQRRIETISRFTAAFGLAFTVGGIWFYTLQGSKEVRTTLQGASKILKSPAGFGIAMLVAATLMGLTGWLGSGTLGEPLSRGFVMSPRNSLLLAYEFATFVLLPLLFLIAVEAGTAISKISSREASQACAVAVSLSAAALATVSSGLISRAIPTCAWI